MLLKIDGTARLCREHENMRSDYFKQLLHVNFMVIASLGRFDIFYCFFFNADKVFSVIVFSRVDCAIFVDIPPSSSTLSRLSKKTWRIWRSRCAARMASITR